MKVHRSRSVRRVEVTTDGKNLVSHAGTALLCELADRTGLTRAMSEAMADCGISWHTHDPGVVLTHLAVAIADGADCLSDFEALRRAVRAARRRRLGLDGLASGEGDDLARAAPYPTERWQLPGRCLAAAPPGDITIDVDATLLNVHSEKQDAASTYKRGYGFHPLGAWCDTTGEPLDVDPASGQRRLERRRRPPRAARPGDRRACRPSTRPATSPATTRGSCDTTSSCGPTRPGRPMALSPASSRRTSSTRSATRSTPAVREALLLFQEEDWADGDRGGRRPPATAPSVAELSDLMDLRCLG